ncbi:SAM and SH3 domain-containing protein 3-like isoform X2 [Amphibalanus amphitrite]|uniref:SAM and SH3 domain-containing protein 3-like isoform X2 n=1 Tax=Amphibalanus amphitrite TaxID=1232801 RepID=UPI001C918292|nr:SAM and SH3 domain-containing protein 3-like isoform X2 [Amphibalanus amphitrite]XP_043216138.1 SAM and SH3 domain-containing protein 3-like isoform X2 [Amphibalanus amphitrite]XP_043216139.1 SAM and SH3 domain-containing protein 3-like isoform X2 [Amphibalanus amphitrite]
MQSVFTKDETLMSHIGRTPQAVRTFMLNKARKIRRSRSASQGRSQQRTLSEDPDMGPDDVIIDSSVPHDSERSGRRLSSLVHGVQSLKRRLAARQLTASDSERRLHRASVDSRSSDGSELSSSGSEPVMVGSNRSSLLSNMSSSSEDSDVSYRGPTVGRARARVDYVPSPYDREALRFSRGDIIDIISMNPSGLWRGALHGRVGTFKFINVEVLPDEVARLREAGGVLPPLKTRPVSVKHLLEELGVSEYASIFHLHGFDSVEDFHSLEAEQLSDLGIVDPEHRSSLLGAAQVLTAGPDAYGAEPLCDFSQPLLSELIRDSGCYDVWRLTEETATSEGDPTERPTSPAAEGAPHPDGAPAAGPASRPDSPSLDRTEPRQEEGEDRAEEAGEEERQCPPEESAAAPAVGAPEQNSETLPAEAGQCAAAETSEAGDLVHAQPATVTPAASDAARQATPPRAAVDFARKFESARSVFEPNCVRRQIPVGVRGRTPVAESAGVGDEVTV